MRPTPAASPLVFRETFDDPAKIQRDWLATGLGTAGAQLQIDVASAKLTAPDGESEVVLRHGLDVARLRGKRARITARVRTELSARSWARVTVVVVPPRGSPSYRDRAITRKVDALSWTDAQAVIDVDPAATSAELSLVLHGEGTAWFDDVEIAELGPARPWETRPLAPRQLDNVVALTRAIGLVRYFHPSDQAAELDWDRFTAMAIERVLAAPDPSALREQLAALFASIAPTAEIYAGEAPAVAALPRPEAATYLARWRHFGLGPYGAYYGFREGRSSEQRLRVNRSTAVQLLGGKPCRKARVEAKAKLLGGSGRSWVFLELARPMSETKREAQEITSETREVSFEAEVPDDLRSARTGVSIRGRATVSLEQLSITCDQGARTPVPITAGWAAEGADDLYEWSVASCESGSCATYARRPLDTEAVPARDAIDLELGSGLRIRLPTAVWANDLRTLPEARVGGGWSDYTMADVPARLAAVSTAWATMSLFYPYFDDLQIDWPSVLAPALVAASASRTPEEHHAALARLITKLRDGHARVGHPVAPITGMWPLALRRFGDKLIVIGGLEAFRETVPVGSEVISIDGTPALEVYDHVHTQITGSPDGHEMYTAWYMTLGPVGAFRRIRIRTAEGKESEHVFALVSKDIYDPMVKDRRPTSGTEVAPGIYYVDFEALKTDAWRQLVPKLRDARALILDYRGYISSAGIDALSYFADRELHSPPMWIPRVGTGAAAFLDGSWILRPASPRLTMPLVALTDGRSISAVETGLQIYRENRLGISLGETTMGTNGNTNMLELPGEFTVRFTGLRVGAADGTTVQGRGFAPDFVVRPTLEGIRAGRDEVLEAGIKAAQEQVAKSGVGKQP